MSKGSKQSIDIINTALDDMFMQWMVDAAEEVHSARPDPAPTFARAYNGPQDPEEKCLK